jgi:hypothetical protein
MPESFTAEFEQLSGDTESSTQFAYTLQWDSATITLRQRAPHTFEFRLPRSTVPYQHAVDFRAGRQLWVKRNGAHWFSGFMNCATLTGYNRADRAFNQISLPGWGNAYALMFDRNTHIDGFIGVSYAINDVDGLITNILDECEHGSGGDWFPAAQRTIYASATGIPAIVLSGKSGLELINDLCDVDGASWRTGINSSGVFTIAVGTTVAVDRSSSIKLFDGANCQIVDLQRDGSLITTNVIVACKRPQLDTRVTNNVIAGATTVVLDSVAGLIGGTTAAEGDAILLGVGLATEESRLVSSISGTTVTVPALTNLHNANEVVKMALPGTYRTTQRNAAAGVAQTYHERYFVLYNDALIDQTRRTGVGDAYIRAYDHPLMTATVEIVDAALITLLLNAGLEPGDSIRLTSADAELNYFYNDTTVTVQEMTLELEPGQVKQITLTIGDPRQDEFTRFERRLQAMQATATVAYGT